MTTLLDTIAAFFDENDWPYERPDETSVLMTGFRGENGEWPCLAWVDEGEEHFVFYSKYSGITPEDKRNAVAELVTRINYNLIFGNFELDFDDGEIRFKTSISVRNDRLTTALVESMVISNVMMLDRYLPCLNKVISSDISPKEAVAEIETSPT